MEFKVFDLGKVHFKAAWDFQKEIFLKVKSGSLESGLILCRHNPVITLGRPARPSNILISTGELRNRGIEVYNIERGGDVTYHGPGQLTAYPIFDLRYFNRDIHAFLRYLEDVAINLLSDFDISAVRRYGFTGAWMGAKKIASIGISVKNWISLHGVSVNIKQDDLDNFRLIRPCGMDIEMASLESALGRKVDFEAVKNKIITKFKACLPAGREGIYDQSTLAGIR